MRILVVFALLTTAAACGRMDHMGKPPSFTPTMNNQEHFAMMNKPLPLSSDSSLVTEQASLWSGGKSSLLGDRRAMARGDIMTIVIAIDDEAEISNETQRSRKGSESLAMPQLFGVSQRLNEKLPAGASADQLVSIDSTGRSSGDGSVSRSEKLTLRVAATVVDVLPNGILAIEGSQELRVNFEMRELLVSGFVRPADVSRQNEVTYDKIASARVSYGGRGQITDVQQPRYGQQILDAVLPF